MNMLTFILGVLFGLILQYAGLNKFNVISGLAIRENYAVAKAIALAIGVGAVLLNVEIALGWSTYHVKPFVLGGLVVGGLLFGMGMAILGYCPGTLAISLGEGSMDALVGIAGALAAGAFYTMVLPFIEPVLGPNFGKLSLHSLLGTKASFFIALLLIGALLVWAAFRLHGIDKNKDKKWIIAGLALALLNTIVFATAVSNRPIGASTTFPYLGDLLSAQTDSPYFIKIQKPGHWELIFLLGALVAGLLGSLVKQDFKIRMVHDNWRKHKGSSPVNRALWAFAGGFILVFGARMAGGCTSGHILSGGMQVAFSSFTFAVFVFAGLLLTGRWFYKK